MSTLDRLRDLAEIAGDELMSDSHVEFFNEFFVAWPKIRAVVEAAKRQRDQHDQDRPISFELERALEALESYGANYEIQVR